MPPLPWSTVNAAPTDQPCVVMASRLPLKHHRDIPAFLRRTLAIRGQLRAAPGLIGYALDADLWHATFLTVSAWTDQSQLSAFAAADPHAGSVRQTRPHMRPSTFVTWTTTTAALPIGWEDVRTRLSEQGSGQRRPDA